MHRLQDIRILLDGIQERAFQPSMILSALRFARWGHSGEQFFSLVRPSVPEVGLMLSLFKQLTRIAGSLFVISLPAIVVLSVRAWSHWKERQDACKYVILAVWLWIPLLAACVQPGGPTPRSMAILFPAGFLAMGLLLDRITRWSGLPILRAWWCELAAVAVWLFCLLLITWNTYGVIHLYGFVAHHDTNGGYGIPYRFWRLTADLVRREVVAEDTDQVWVIAEGSDINSDEQPMLLHYLLEPDIQTVFLGRDGYECMPLPAARAGVYLFTRPSHFVENTIHQLGGEDRGLVLFPEKPAKAEVTVIEAQPVEEMLALIPSPNLQALDSGVRLLGHDHVASAKPGQTITIATYWTFADVPHRVAEAQHAWLMALQSQKGVEAVGCTGFGLPGGLCSHHRHAVHLGPLLGRTGRTQQDSRHAYSARLGTDHPLVRLRGECSSKAKESETEAPATTNSLSTFAKSRNPHRLFPYAVVVHPCRNAASALQALPTI